MRLKDGYRKHARLERGKAELLTRTSLDWTHKYPPIASALSSLPIREVYLDGESLRGSPGREDFVQLDSSGL